MENRVREMERPFFDLTDENGVSYVNLKDEIECIPVRSKKRDQLKRLDTYYMALNAMKGVTNE